jgi:hypothetical protein
VTAGEVVVERKESPVSTPRPIGTRLGLVPEIVRKVFGRFTRKVRQRLRPMPPGATPMHLAVPAYWALASPEWPRLRAAGSAVSIVVVEQSWPQTAKGNAQWKQDAQACLASLAGATLGYVYARDGAGQLLAPDEILSGAQKNDSVTAWYDEFGGQIDGVYLDDLVLYSDPDPNQMTKVQDIIGQFRADPAKPWAGAKLMILAGQSLEPAVVGPGVSWVLLAELPVDNTAPPPPRPYLWNYYPIEAITGGTKTIPPWWKDPAHRDKIVHVAHSCSEPEHQRALSLAVERNVGHVFVMDDRGPNGAYDHLPPYWEVEVNEVTHYTDFGFDPLRALQAAHRYGVANGSLHAWPNFEAAWYGSRHVRGTYLVDQNSGLFRVDVALSALAIAPAAPPALYDVPAIWRAAHEWAQGQYETAVPTFDPAGGMVGLIVFPKGLGWLQRHAVPVADTYQRPTFAEPGAVIRNLHRWAVDHGYETGLPTFLPDNLNDPTGRAATYDCYLLGDGGVLPAAPVTWSDVETDDYIAEL